MGILVWDMNAVNQMALAYTNKQAAALHAKAEENVGGRFPLGFYQATADDMVASVRSGPIGLIAEYGTAEQQPQPWGLKTLMESSVG